MQAGYYFLENKNIKSFSKVRIIDVKFTNAVNQLSGVFECTFTAPDIKTNNEIKSSLVENDDFNVYFGNDDVKFLLMRGILVSQFIIFRNNEYKFSIGLTHKTNKIKRVAVKLFEYQDVINNANQVIQKLLKDNNCNKLYDRLIPLRNGLKIDNQSYSGEGESVYTVFEKILNDVSASFFTTTIKNDVVLYLYDRGLSLKANQSIRNDNLIEFSIEINWENFYDNIDVVSEEGISDVVDMRTIGEPAIMKFVNKNKTFNRISPALNKIRKKINSLDLPQTSFVKTLKSSSNSIDSQEYASFMLKQTFDEGIIIECIVNSMFIDVKNKTLGIWELGGKIKIINDNVFNDLKALGFDYYLQNDEKYHFIIKAIQVINNNQVRLLLGLSDIFKTS